QIGLPFGDDPAYLLGSFAFASDEADIFKLIPKEIADMRLAVGNAHPRRHFSPAKRDHVDCFFDSFLRFHRSPPALVKSEAFWRRSRPNLGRTGNVHSHMSA